MAFNMNSAPSDNSPIKMAQPTQRWVMETTPTAKLSQPMTPPALAAACGFTKLQAGDPDSGKYNKSTHYFILSYLMVGK